MVIATLVIGNNLYNNLIDSLLEKGIPAVCTNDGPSGIRLQAHSTLLPIGIGLACTFDDELVEEFKEKGIKMIAEGVETEEEFNYIRDNTDIEYVQGYYLARPN